MAEHNHVGKKGEILAQEYLANNGYVIQATNWRYGVNEIDIIAKKDHFLIFIEVKTRSSSYFGEPEFFVSRSQQKTYLKLANAYVQKNNLFEEVRFDIIAIVWNKQQYTIKHIERAFSTIL